MEFLRVIRDVVVTIAKLVLRIIRGAIAIVAPSSCEVCTAVVHEFRRRCCDIFLSCFLTAMLYFSVYLFFGIPSTIECDFDSSVRLED